MYRKNLSVIIVLGYVKDNGFYDTSIPVFGSVYSTL